MIGVPLRQEGREERPEHRQREERRRERAEYVERGAALRS